MCVKQLMDCCLLDPGSRDPEWKNLDLEYTVLPDPQPFPQRNRILVYYQRIARPTDGAKSWQPVSRRERMLARQKISACFYMQLMQHAFHEFESRKKIIKFMFAGTVDPD